MKKQTPFLISGSVVWVLVIVNFSLTVLGIFAHLLQWPAPNYALTLGGIIFFSAWLIVLQDMLQQKIYNKTYWLASLFILPSISLVVYLIQRQRLMRLGQRF
jgi:hypothetical protein